VRKPAARPNDEPRSTEDAEGTPFERFEKLARRLVKVPKREVDGLRRKPGDQRRQ
jgi:hypothetical protein